MDHVLLFMLNNRIELTLENYVALNWMGDKTIQDLDAEELPAIPGELTDSGTLGTGVGMKPN